VAALLTSAYLRLAPRFFLGEQTGGAPPIRPQPRPGAAAATVALDAPPLPRPAPAQAPPEPAPEDAVPASAAGPAPEAAAAPPGARPRAEPPPDPPPTRPAGQNGRVNLPVDSLADWSVAKQVADRVAGPGPVLGPVERARLREDFAELVPQAERLVADFSGLRPNGHPSRPWVMSRSEWLGQNLSSFQVVLQPIAERAGSARTDGPAAGLR